VGDDCESRARGVRGPCGLCGLGTPASLAMCLFGWAGLRFHLRRKLR
jgi:hypothetical protein